MREKQHIVIRRHKMVRTVLSQTYLPTPIVSILVTLKAECQAIPEALRQVANREEITYLEHAE